MNPNSARPHPTDDALPAFSHLLHERTPGPVVAVYDAAGTSMDDISRIQVSWWPGRHATLRYRIDGRGSDRETPVADTTVLEAGGISLDLRTRKVEVDGSVIDLSAREFALAETLMHHPGQVLSREQLLSRVWGYDFDPGSNVVDVYVGYPRKKLGSNRIETVRGMGYRFVAG